MDFMYPCDPALVISPRGIHRTGSTAEKPLTWISQYGSVITVVEDIFTSEGMNEEGLSAHAQAFTSQEQTVVDSKGPVLDSNYWINYILDTHATVQEVVDDLQHIKMRAVFFPVTYPTDSKHIAVEDKTGDAAVIEISHGQLNIYHGKEYRVMTNYPTYDKHLAAYKKQDNNKIPLDSGAESRFIRLSYHTGNIPEPRNSTEALAYMNSVINSAAFVMGQPVPEEDQPFVDTYAQYADHKEELRGASTYWQTLSDLNNKAYYFKSVSSPNYLKVDMDDIDFDHLTQVRHLDNIMKIPASAGNQLVKQFQPQKGDIYSRYHG